MVSAMDNHTALGLLEELADKLGIPIRCEIIHDELTGLGGICRVEGKFILIIDSKATAKEKVQIMIEALRRFDLRDVYVRPALRELLDEYEK
jgi:N-dimethylarginine dimethylaminohydrolase